MTAPVFGAGSPLYAEDLNALVAIANKAMTGISNPATTAGSDTTASASYVNMAGTGSVTSFSFTKLISSTRLFVWEAAGWQNSVGVSDMSFGVNVNSVDYECARQSLNTTTTIGFISGFAIISGLAANTYTIQGRWKKRSGAGTPTRSNAEILAIYAVEIL